MRYDVLIIGGGAAGLSAALSASGQGARTAVLEAAPRVGRKILASGNGRCNLANTGAPNYPGNGGFAQAVLKACPVEDVLSFFHGLGLVTVEEDGGRVYPGCGQAAAVLDVLRAGLERRAVPLICEGRAESILPTAQGFRVRTAGDTYEARRIVVACGSPAGGKLGHDGEAYSLLTALGHTLIPPRPALAPLTAEKSAVKGLSGLRLPAILTLCRKKDGRALWTSQGEILFTDYGVSGVCAMELARFAQEEQKRAGAWPLLSVDFSPMLGIAPRCYRGAEAAGDPLIHQKDMLACLEARRHILPLESILQGLAPRLLADRLRGLSLADLARSLAAFPVPLTGVRGLEYAQVAAGGIDTNEFDPLTLQSRLVPGLYAAGEMLDVDGACGGFNLQFAWASGIIAGRNAAKRRVES